MADAGAAVGRAGAVGSALRAVKRGSGLFATPRAASGGAFLDGLLGPELRRARMRAQAAGDPGPWRQQAVLGRRRRDADALRDPVRDSALETLAVPDAVLVLDETGFLNRAPLLRGAAEYTGPAGKIADCQIGVLAAYVSDRGHAFIDRQLYLPRSWADQPDRRRAAHVPDDVHFATKPAIAVAMLGRALKAGVSFASGRRRQHLRRGRGRDGPAPRRQGLRARGRRHASVLLLGRGAGGRHGGRDRPRPAGIGLGTSLGG